MTRFFFQVVFKKKNNDKGRCFFLKNSPSLPERNGSEEGCIIVSWAQVVAPRRWQQRLAVPSCSGLLCWEEQDFLFVSMCGDFEWRKSEIPECCSPERGFVVTELEVFSTQKTRLCYETLIACVQGITRSDRDTSTNQQSSAFSSSPV